MIPRYSRPDMVAIWSPETKFRIWFEIEAYACDALAELGVIPKSAAETIWEKGGKAEFDVARIDEIEAVTKHDVQYPSARILVAMVAMIGERMRRAPGGVEGPGPAHPRAATIGSRARVTGACSCSIGAVAL